MAQIGDRLRTKGTLGPLKKKTVLLQGAEDCPDVMEVTLPRIVVNQDVVKEYQDKAMWKGTENLIHESLECRRSIRQSKGHHQELEESLMCPERHLCNIRWLHEHLMIPRMQVQFCKKKIHHVIHPKVHPRPIWETYP